MPVTLLLPAKYLNFSAPLRNLFFSKISNKIDEKTLHYTKFILLASCTKNI